MSLLLGSHTYSVRAFCFGRRVCLSFVCVSSIISRKLSEISAKFRHRCRISGSPSKNMTSDFAPEVAKCLKSSPKPQNSVRAYCLAPLAMQLGMLAPFSGRHTCICLSGGCLSVWLSCLPDKIFCTHRTRRSMTTHNQWRVLKPSHQGLAPDRSSTCSGRSVRGLNASIECTLRQFHYAVRRLSFRYNYYNHFMALWTLSGTTRVSRYFAIFRIFGAK